MSAVILVACSDDQTASNTGDGGSTGGSGTSTGGGSSGGGATNTGGHSAGGATNTGGGGATNTGGGGATNTGGGGATNTGGRSAGGASGAGGATTDGGDASTGTGGATTDGGSCSVLSACCSTFTGRRRTACQNVANAGVATNCTAVEDVFCGDGGIVGPGGGGGDAFVNCATLKTCCNALADGGREAAQCNRVVTNGHDNTCNQVAVIFCN